MIRAFVVAAAAVAAFTATAQDVVRPAPPAQALTYTVEVWQASPSRRLASTDVTVEPATARAPSTAIASGSASGCAIALAGVAGAGRSSQGGITVGLTPSSFDAATQTVTTAVFVRQGGGACAGQSKRQGATVMIGGNVRNELGSSTGAQLSAEGLIVTVKVRAAAPVPQR